MTAGRNRWFALAAYLSAFDSHGGSRLSRFHDHCTFLGIDNPSKPSNVSVLQYYSSGPRGRSMHVNDRVPMRFAKYNISRGRLIKRAAVRIRLTDWLVGSWTAKALIDLMHLPIISSYRNLERHSRTSASIRSHCKRIGPCARAKITIHFFISCYADTSSTC